MARSGNTPGLRHGSVRTHRYTGWLRRRSHLPTGQVTLINRQSRDYCVTSHVYVSILRMKTTRKEPQQLALSFAAAWHRLERRLSNSLSAVRGISLAEYRLLRTLAEAHDMQASRVDLAYAMGVTPSGVTRALRPLEKLGMVTTVKSERDARLAIATLTPAGREVVDDASMVVDDSMTSLLKSSTLSADGVRKTIEMLDRLAR